MTICNEVSFLYFFYLEGDWKLAANINPCDGNNFGYGGPWSKGSDVGTFSQAFHADYLNDSIWREPLNYITSSHINWWHDAGKIGPACHGTPSQGIPKCETVGTDHGLSLDDGDCWGSYAIYVSEEAKSFQCQGRNLAVSLTPRTYKI